MTRKPSNLIYGVDEKPPLGVILILAFQHLFFLGVGLVIPVMTMRIIGSTPEEIRSVVSLSMICAGSATIIQSLNKGPVGSGYLCGQGNDPSVLAFSVMAGKLGGAAADLRHDPLFRGDGMPPLPFPSPPAHPFPGRGDRRHPDHGGADHCPLYHYPSMSWIVRLEAWGVI